MHIVHCSDDDVIFEQFLLCSALACIACIAMQIACINEHCNASEMHLVPMFFWDVPINKAPDVTSTVTSNHHWK